MTIKSGLVKRVLPFVFASMVSLPLFAGRDDCKFIDSDGDEIIDTKECVKDNGKCLEKTYFDSIGNITRKEVMSDDYTITEYKYNQKGDLIEQTEKKDFNGDKKPDFIKTIKYDEKGNKRFYSEDSNGDLKPEQITEFDEDENIVKDCYSGKEGLLCDFFENKSIFSKKKEFVAQGIDKDYDGNCEIINNYSEDRIKQSTFVDINDDGNTERTIFFTGPKGQFKYQDIFYFCEDSVMNSRTNNYYPNGNKRNSLIDKGLEGIVEEVIIYNPDGSLKEKLINNDSNGSFEEKLYFKDNQLVQQELDSSFWKFEYSYANNLSKINKFDKDSNLISSLSFTILGGKIREINYKNGNKKLKNWIVFYDSKDKINRVYFKFRDVSYKWDLEKPLEYPEFYKKVLKEVGNEGNAYKELKRE